MRSALLNAETHEQPSFPERVYEVVREIPVGQVTTYGTIAATLGERRAARMVGWAMSNCPDDISEVAHRVVNRYGELSGGWAWGHPEVMKGLLVDEGVTFVDDFRVDLKRHLWIPPIPSDRDGQHNDDADTIPDGKLMEQED